MIHWNSICQISFAKWYLTIRLTFQLNNLTFLVINSFSSLFMLITIDLHLYSILLFHSIIPFYYSILFLYCNDETFWYYDVMMYWCYQLLNSCNYKLIMTNDDDNDDVDDEPTPIFWINLLWITKMYNHNIIELTSMNMKSKFSMFNYYINKT